MIMLNMNASPFYLLLTVLIGSEIVIWCLLHWQKIDYFKSIAEIDICAKLFKTLYPYYLSKIH